MKKTITASTFVIAFWVLATTASAVERLVPTPEYPTIQSAINAAVNGDTVIIAPGTYTGEGNRDIDFLGKAITVRSSEPNDPNIVAATIIDCNGTYDDPHRGFYFHSGEGADSVLNGLTIISGYGYEGGGAIYCQGSSPAIINCVVSNNPAFWWSDGMRFEYSTSTIANCIVDANFSEGVIHCYNSNLTITNSTITTPSGRSFQLYGSKIHSENSNLTITNCTISGNSGDDDNGGISCRGGSLTITKSTISGNTAEEGGGISCGDCNLTVTGCTIRDNYAWISGSGGGISCDSSNAEITDCTFNGNSSPYDYYAGGGAVYCGYDSNMTINNCTISDNSGGGIGSWQGRLTITDCNISNNDGGISCSESILTINNCIIGNDTGGIYCRDSSSTVTNCSVSNNLSEYSCSGIYCSGGISTITNCNISNNISGWDGGGVYCSGNNSTIANCTISGNSISNRHYYGNGGGIYCSGATVKNCVISNNSALWLGGGIYCSNSTISNCSITGNSAPASEPDRSGGGIYCSGSGSIINSIIWDNYYNQIGGSMPAGSIKYCAVQGGWPGKGNIDTNPLLTQDGHLQKDSPCINAGDPNYSPLPGETDIDSEARITAGRIDMGADEFLDGDSDGLPDFWEVKYFGNTTIANPADDPDGDGYDNLAEYAHSTEPNAAPADYYVNPQTGDDTYDGLAPAWDDRDGPKKTIQAAVNACAVNRGDTVVLAQDTYTGDGNRDVDFCGKIITVRSTDPQEPNVVAATIIDCQGTEASPHRGFVLHSGEGSTSIIAGLTITNGYGPLIRRYYYTISVGGAIFCDNTSPTIRNCVISNNIAYSGGGIYCRGGSPIITDCNINGNLAKGYYAGAGIYCEYSNPTITNCAIHDNSTIESYRCGGGIGCKRGNPTIINCIISRNFAGGGGGIYSEDSCLTVTNSQITDNSASGAAGIRYISGPSGSYEPYNPGNLVIDNCIISGNCSQGYGGGINFSANATGTIINSTITGNSAKYGGAIYCWSFEKGLKIANCKISGNFASQYGGAISFGLADLMTITNCTFADNSAPNGNAIAGIYYPANIQLTNSILWDGGNEILNNNGSAISIAYSNISGGYSGIGNINTDPCFVQPGFWADPNNTPTDPNDDVWTDGDYHLRHGSPCINTGDPNYTAEPNETDLDGKPRIIGGRIDMGAYEFNHIPIANAGPNQTIEAQAPWGVKVTLNGSNSSDADSTPGTNDDIVSFDWYEQVDPCDPNADILLGTGQILDCNLPLGTHTIILEVTDKAGASDADEVIITVQDTTPPQLTLSVTPTTLWPLNKKMTKITPTWTVTDLCDPDPNVSLVNIQINEPGTGDIQTNPDGSIYLRAWRSGTGKSRIYTITFQAVDDSGNSARSSATVTVPHDQRTSK